METQGGILARLGEKVLGWIALGMLILLGIGIWQMGPEGRGALWSGIWRTAVWLVVATVLPWSVRLLITRLLEISSNWVGVALLAGLTLVNLGLGLILLQGLPSGVWGWLSSLAALAIVATYNYLVTEYLAEQAGG
jgi:hypothetical protein